MRAAHSQQAHRLESKGAEAGASSRSNDAPFAVNIAGMGGRPFFRPLSLVILVSTLAIFLERKGERGLLSLSLLQVMHQMIRPHHAMQSNDPSTTQEQEHNQNHGAQKSDLKSCTRGWTSAYLQPAGEGRRAANGGEFGRQLKGCLDSGASGRCWDE